MLHLGRALIIVCCCISAMPLGGVEKKSPAEEFVVENALQEELNMSEQNRPQTPQPPSPYRVEDVSYQNDVGGTRIAGTLTIPSGAGPFPAVLLIAGMGPMDRDAAFMGHKRFAVMANYFTRHGIAVLRVDKRGVGKSSGIFSPDVTTKDLAGDVLAGIAYLKTRAEIKPDQIGLIGHSEGGLIATMVAAQSKDVAFAVLMSGALLTSVDGQVATTAAQLRFDGGSDTIIGYDCAVRKQLLDVVVHEENQAIAAQKMDDIITQYWMSLSEEQKSESEKLAFAFTLAKKDGFVAMFNSPWFRFFLSYDVSAALKQITIPLLVLNGGFDFNRPDLAFPIVEKALKESGHSDYTTLAFPDVNHNFQTCQTGSIPEYGTLEETIKPFVLQVVLDWVLARSDAV